MNIWLLLRIGQVHICPEASLCHHLWALCLWRLQTHWLWSPRYTRVAWHQGGEQRFEICLIFTPKNQIKREKFLAKRALQDMVEARPPKEKEVVEQKTYFGSNPRESCDMSLCQGSREVWRRCSLKPTSKEPGACGTQLLSNWICQNTNYFSICLSKREYVVFLKRLWKKQH